MTHPPKLTINVKKALADHLLEHTRAFLESPEGVKMFGEGAEAHRISNQTIQLRCPSFLRALGQGPKYFEVLVKETF